jgi:hypothetical protein
MTTSLETKGILPSNEGAVKVRTSVERRQLVWRFLLVFALIVAPVGIATLIAHWVRG